MEEIDEKWNRVGIPWSSNEKTTESFIRVPLHFVAYPIRSDGERRSWRRSRRVSRRGSPSIRPWIDYRAAWTREPRVPRTFFSCPRVENGRAGRFVRIESDVVGGLTRRWGIGRKCCIYRVGRRTRYREKLVALEEEGV